jgi:hypothetical protein
MSSSMGRDDCHRQTGNGTPAATHPVTQGVDLVKEEHERARKREKGRRLAHLPRRVQVEVRLLIHEPAHPGQTLLGREHVVQLRLARAGGIEVTGHRGARLPTQGPRPRRIALRSAKALLSKGFQGADGQN